MRFHIITLFPEMMDNIMSFSIIGRAAKKGAIDISSYHFRDYSQNKHHNVDDTPYGGGMGMLLTVEPIYNCHKAVTGKIETLEKKGLGTRTVYMSPKGKVLNQKKSEELAEYDDLIVICGHYEGVDERVIDLCVDEEISIGDFVLTGGELPCAILIDSVARLVPGVLKGDDCHKMDSISSGLLEYPHYTRPPEFNGISVPDVLLTGHHGNIEKWRHEQSLLKTAVNRPDILEKYRSRMTAEDYKFLADNGIVLESLNE